MNWFVYTRGTIHLHRIATAKIAIHKLSSKLLGMPFHDVLYINQGEKLWWAWNEQEINALGQKIIKTCSKKSTAKKHLAKLERLGKQAIVKAKISIQTNLINKSPRQLAAAYNLLCKDISPAHALLDPDIDAIDIVFEPFLQEQIKKALPDHLTNTYLEVYKKLSVPLYTSYLNAQEMATIKVALQKTVKDEAILGLQKKFWWTALGWENIKPHTTTYFKHEIRVLRQDKKLKNHYQTLLNRVKENKKQRQATLRYYHLPKSILYWLEIFDHYTKMHDLRKEMQVKTVFAQYRFLKELNRRYNYDIELLEWLWTTEVTPLFFGKKPDFTELTRRQQCIAAIVSKNGIKLLSGAKAVQEKNRQLNLNTHKVTEIKGVSVTHGKIVGIAKVCNGYKEALAKITTNDVLITGMTLPDYLPAMKKAKAIVTDEGGITCHAAIVSRELGKVCIVGTKIATQALKDGDKIEVDANKGIIKKI